MDLLNESRLLHLITLAYITVSVSGIQNVSVSCRNQTVCALRESSVSLTCSYSNIYISTGFWFNLKDKAKWRKEEHPEDLALDSDYAGRVSYTEMTNFSSTLTIRDLRERDSGEYRLLFITDKGEKYLSSAGVTLTVTDLQVTRDSTQQALNCSTSCFLTSGVHRFYWYKNGQYLEKHTDNMETLPIDDDDDDDDDSYSCSVHGYNDILSQPLCIGGSCWGVTYTNRRVCALEGSSVELTGSYSHPSDQSVNKVFWHYDQSSKVFQDLKQERQISDRVEYVNKNRTLKVNKLSKKDSAEYRLRFLTKGKDGKGGKPFSGRPGVVLSVTDLQVRVSHSAVVSEGQTTVTLSCITSCTLSNNPTYTWYKNTQPVTNKLTKHNKLYLISSEDSGIYSCAVRGREDLRSPEQTVTLSGDDPYSESSVNTIPIAVGVIVFLALVFIAGALWMWWRKSKSVKTHDRTEGTDPQSGQDEMHYSSIHFPPATQGSSLSKLPRHTTEEEHIQYAEVNIKRSTAAT